MNIREWRDSEPNRFHFRRVLTIAAGHAAHDTYTAFLAPLLPLFIAALALSKTQAGLLAVFLQMPWLLQPLIGHLADRRHARHIVVFAPAVSAITMSLLGIAPTYAALALLLLLAGLSSAAFHAVGPAMVSTLSGTQIGRGMGIWMVGGELGRTLGPLVAVTSVQFLALTGMPWVMVAGVLASLLLHWQLRETLLGTDDRTDRLPLRVLMRSLGRLLLPVAGIIFLRSFLVAALGLYLPLFLSEEGRDLWSAGMALTVLEGAGVIGALLGGTVSDRLGRRSTLAFALAATPLFMFVFLMTSGWIQLVLIVLLGLTGLSVTPVMLALVHENFPGNRALANSVYMVMSFVLRTIGVMSLGATGDLLGLRTAFAVSAGVALIAVPLVLQLPGSQNRRD